MIVRTIEEYEVIYQKVQVYMWTQRQKNGTGLWSFGCFTVSVFVPKSICEIIEE